MKAPRKRFPPSVYRAILVKQAWRCACCDERFYFENSMRPNTYHFDHILPLELGGKDEPENLQALKRGHHQSKTDRETAARAKTKRIIAQRGLLDKKPSERDKVMGKILQEG